MRRDRADAAGVYTPGRSGLRRDLEEAGRPEPPRRTPLTLPDLAAGRPRPLGAIIRAAAREAAAALRDPVVLTLALAFAALAAIFILASAYVPARGDLVSAGRLAAIVGAGAAALAAGLCVAVPWTGLVIWLVAIPIINVARADLAIGPLQVISTTVLLAALVVGWVLRGRPLPDRRVALPGAFVILLALLSTAFSPSPAASFTIALHGLVEPLVLAGLVVALRPTRGQLIALLAALVVSVTLGAVINLVRLPSLVATFHDVDIARGLLARLTYFNIGIFGDVLVMALPLALVGLGRWRDLRLPVTVPVVAGICLIVMVWSVYITVTKSAWIAALVVSLLFAASFRGRQRLAVGAAVLAVAGALVLAGPSLAPRLGLPVTTGSASSGGAARIGTLDPSTPEGEVSVTERVYATVAAARMAIDHPVLGVGPGQFMTAYERYRPASATRLLTSAHDFFPDLGAEFGLPVAAVVAASFLVLLLSAWRLTRRGDAEERVLATALGLAIVGFLIVATLFGLDLYRANRLMNSDVVMIAVIAAGLTSLALAHETAAREPHGQPAIPDGSASGATDPA